MIIISSLEDLLQILEKKEPPIYIEQSVLTEYLLLHPNSDILRNAEFSKLANEKVRKATLTAITETPVQSMVFEVIDKVLNDFLKENLYLKLKEKLKND